ncbi:helix-turn-helix domain-containing protein [Flavobacterium aquidurense]|uniref:AraC-like DNA-binding protein n=2 Tax=Flavobacterium TaxID=237 RepID=A0A7W7IWN2_9FLAO|nr:MULTISPECIES: helix-turn-helix domain-containing protein [Flavobacterium]MBB4801718.1 AraC-like DNA-binding protein [Flavobacterium nitrogenifigens]MBB6386676.1 AraC-like DNA-binding protein [Flavobacterium notoginsengisoli]
MLSEYKDNTLAQFSMHVNCNLFKGPGLTKPSKPINTFVYNKGQEQSVKIDEITYTMPAGSILPLVANQNFVFEHPDRLVAWQFNREFYCIVDHDAEVGCVGFLFYGIEHPMFIQLNQAEIDEMEQLQKMFSLEWPSKDNFQGEMLRTLLKYLIIKVTRTAKLQNDSYQKFSDEKMDIVRKFSLLLEEKFKTQHGVKYYAEQLNKSPKTLSNIFAILGQPSPSKIIHTRVILEAKRYLHYTDKTAKEIAYEIGFESPAHFSRFFKLQTGLSISEFKEIKLQKNKTKE